MHDWNGDVLVVDTHGNVFIQVVLSPWFEVDRCLREKDVDLLFDLPFTDLVVLHVGAVDVMLWSSLLVLNLLHLLLEDSFLLGGFSVLVDSLARVFLLELNHLLLVESVLLVKLYLVNLRLDLFILNSQNVIVSLVLDFKFS